MVGGAAMATAQDGSSGDLGDYPAPFVDDGEVDTNIVVGDDAKTIDVVGAVDIAGALSQHAYTETTEAVGGAAGSWAASNGVTLSTANQNLFLNDQVASVRDTLTSDDLNALETTTFVDDAGDDTDIDYYYRLTEEEDAQVQFGQSDYMSDEEEDPQLHVPVEEAENGGLYSVEAVFGSGIDFADDDVQGEDIELFGRTFTIADDQTDEENALTLYGSSERFSVETGDSETITVDGNEHTFEVLVVGSSEAQIRVDGDRETIEEGETVRVSDSEVRARELFADDADLDVTGEIIFAVGSEEINLESGEPIQDADGDDVEGTEVVINGDDEEEFEFDGEDETEVEISTIEVTVGMEDDDDESDDAIRAGESWSHSFFDNIEVHFGGLNPDAADGAAEVEFSTDDEFAEFTVTDTSGNTETLEFAVGEGETDVALAHEDGDYVNVEDETALTEGARFIADQGGFSDMYEVTEVDITSDEDVDNGAATEDGEIELENLFTGDEVEIEVDADDTSVEEIINGQTYVFNVTDGHDEFVLETWDAPSQRPTDANGPALELENGAYLDFDYGTTEAKAIVHEPENTDNAHSRFTVTPVQESAESDEHDLELDNDIDYTEEGSAGYSVTELNLQTLESDDDVEVDYTDFGSYVEYDGDDEGEYTLNLPAVQSSAGVAVTDRGGSVSAEGAGSVTTSTPAGWPDSGLLDSDVGSAERNQNMILVGGPAVNTLVDELAQEGQTQTGDEYTEGQAIVQHIEGAFSDDADALVVAGHSGQDTRNAASALANMNAEAGTLLGEDVAGVGQVTIDTGQNSVVSTE